MSNPTLLPVPCSPLLPTWTPVFPKLCNSFLIDSEFDPNLYCLITSPFFFLLSFFRQVWNSWQIFSSLLLFFTVISCEYFGSGLFLIAVFSGEGLLVQTHHFSCEGWDLQKLPGVRLSLSMGGGAQAWDGDDWESSWDTGDHQDMCPFLAPL